MFNNVFTPQAIGSEQAYLNNLQTLNTNHDRGALNNRFTIPSVAIVTAYWGKNNMPHLGPFAPNRCFQKVKKVL